MVTFQEGVTVLAQIPLGSGGTALFKTSALSAGSHTISAAYCSDTVFASSSGNTTQMAQAYTIATSASPGVGGTTSGGNTYVSGANVTVTATANSGYVFTNWTQSGSVVSTSASYTFTATSNRTLVANFM
jgi:Divergent InlB B-repeat domain